MLPRRPRRSSSTRLAVGMQALGLDPAGGGYAGARARPGWRWICGRSGSTRRAVGMPALGLGPAGGGYAGARARPGWRWVCRRSGSTLLAVGMHVAARARCRPRRSGSTRLAVGMPALGLDLACGRYACCRAREMQAAALGLDPAGGGYAFRHASLPGHVFRTDVQFVLVDCLYVFALKACSHWYIRILAHGTWHSYAAAGMPRCQAR
jgi:hypothetical protein